MSDVVAEAVALEAPPSLGESALLTRCERYGPVAESLVSSSPVDISNEVLVVADAPYPFHPSTGLVTDPAVAGAVANALRTAGATAVSVALAGGPHADRDRTQALLGYETVIEHCDLEWVNPEPGTDRHICHWTGEDGPTWFSVPTDLLDRTVVVVPSLRPTRTNEVAGALRTVARAIDPGLPDAATIAAADVVEPALAILDATTAYADGPRTPGVLVAGGPPWVDAVATRLLDGALEDDPVLDSALEPDERTVTCSGVDIEALGDGLPVGRYPTRTTPGPLVSACYRLYATVTGDAVPPQFDR